MNPEVGRAIAQSPNSLSGSWVKLQGRPCGICGGLSETEAGLFQRLRPSPSDYYFTNAPLSHLSSRSGTMGQFASQYHGTQSHQQTGTKRFRIIAGMLLVEVCTILLTVTVRHWLYKPCSKYSPIS